MTWLNEHASALNVLANFGMLLVWLLYLHVFLTNYLRTRKPRLIVNRASGNDLDAFILVSNMSQEPVYVQNLYCTIQTSEGEVSATVTDREVVQKAGSDETPRGVTNQGPLSRGEFMTVGTFGSLLEITAESGADGPGRLEDLKDTVQSMEIMVVAAFGGDDLEIAAIREYRLDTAADPWGVIPVGPETQQVSSRRERKRIRRMIEAELSEGREAGA